MREHDKRVEVLLEACYNLLKACHDGFVMVDPMLMYVTYDGDENDGYTLLNDIADELSLENV